MRYFLYLSNVKERGCSLIDIKLTIMTTTQINYNNQVIETLINQLGGNMFFMMTGSKPQHKNVNTINPQLSLKLTKNSIKATHLTITYISGIDLYKMEFFKCKKFDIISIKTIDRLFADQLQKTFTEVTGLYTKL